MRLNIVRRNVAAFNINILVSFIYSLVWPSEIVFKPYYIGIGVANEHVRGRDGVQT